MTAAQRDTDDMDMNVLETQLETIRLNLLHHHQQQHQHNNYMLQSNFMPELVGLFDNSSADADMFGWQGEPDIMENDDVNFSEIFPLQTELVHPPTAGPMEVEDAAAVKEVVLLIDGHSDDDVALIDNPQCIPKIDFFSMFRNGNPEFTAEKACNEKRTNVEAAGESSGKKRAKAKPSPYTTNDDPVLQKLECIREQAKRTNGNPEHQSLAEKIRRQRISEMLQRLQEMIPGCKQDRNKSLVDVLTEIIIYLKYLQNQNQLLAKEASRQNSTPENNVNVTQQLLVEETAASRQNPTPEINVNIKPTREGNQSLMVNSSGGRRRRDKANKLAVKKKPHPYMSRYRPAPAGSVSARNANFAYLTQQAKAIYKPDSLAFAVPLITPGSASTSTNWSTPLQYIQQHEPIVWDPETLSLLYQSCYS